MAVDVDTSQLKQDFRIIARKKSKGGRMSLRGVSAELAAVQVNPGLSVATGIHNRSEDHPVSFIHSDPAGGGAGPSSPVYGVPFLNFFGNKNGLRWPALK
jgi:hypothetical protein